MNDWPSPINIVGIDVDIDCPATLQSELQGLVDTYSGATSDVATCRLYRGRLGQAHLTPHMATQQHV